MTAETTKARPLHLSDERLLAEYQKALSNPHQPSAARGLALIRTRMLRERLGLPPLAESAA